MVLFVGELRDDQACAIRQLTDQQFIVACVADEVAAIGWLQRTFPEASASVPTPRHVVGSLSICTAGRRVRVGDRDLTLSDHQYKILERLCAHPGDACCFSDLIECASGSPDGMDIAALSAMIRRLRAKLAVSRSGCAIEAVRGYGFRIVDLAVDSHVVNAALLNPDSDRGPGVETSRVASIRLVDIRDGVRRVGD